MERSLRLVIFGLGDQLLLGQRPRYPVARALHGADRAGATRSFFERDVDWYASNRDLHELPGGRLVLYRRLGRGRASARRELADADAAIVTSYCPDGVAATDLVLDSRVPVRAFYDLDTPVTWRGSRPARRSATSGRAASATSTWC